MKNKELFEKDEKALNKLLADTQAKLLKDKFAVAGRELTTFSEINKSRKLVARIKTILRQKQILATEAAIQKETAKKAKGEK